MCLTHINIDILFSNLYSFLCVCLCLCVYVWAYLYNFSGKKLLIKSLFTSIDS